MTEQDWVEAKKRFDSVRQQYLDLQGVPGVNTTLALRMFFEPLAKRYNSGERTDDLYDEMCGVE